MKVFLAFFLMLPILCNASTGAEFEGKWVHLKYQSSRVQISENGANYLITELRQNHTKKYVGKISDGMLVVNTGLGTASIGIEKESGHLLYGGQEYRRLKNGESFEYIPKNTPVAW